MGRFTSNDSTYDSGSPSTVTFNDILNKPTTLAGYGITDAALKNNIPFSTLVNKPTTLAGYGITDALASTVSFDIITNKPTTLAGYGITDAMGVGGSGEVISLPFSGITEKPITLAGYGITDGQTAADVNTKITAAISNLNSSGTVANATNATNAVNLSGGSITTGINTTPVGAVTGTNVQFMGDTTHSAAISFHRSSVYGINMGLDVDNVFRLGGWSNGLNTYRFTIDSTGNFVATGDVTAFSDERLKKDWLDLPQDFLEKLANVKHGNYTRIDTEEKQVGVSAQELQKVLPNAVMDGEYLSVAYGNAALVSAVELAKEVVMLKKIVAELVQKLNS